MSLKQPEYNRFSKYYDLIELGGGEGPANSAFLDKLFKKNKVKSVLDMTCGTGAQCIGLAKRGYKVTASDLNKKMLELAKQKAKNPRLKIKFLQGNIKTIRAGKFDAVIAMFNSIGHLDKTEFEKAIINVGRNLKSNGLFVFDIFNLDYMKSNFIDHKFIDVLMEKEGIRFVRFNKNKLNFRTGLMIIDQETFIEKGVERPEVYRERWEMQIYAKSWLKEILEINGFKIIKFYNMLGNKTNKKDSLFIFTVAKKT